MSDELWNDDIDYAFSIHRKFMKTLGLWPLQERNIFTIMRWSLTTTLQLTLYIFLYMGLNSNHQNAGANMETVLYITCATSSAMKNFCIIANRKKLARNINSAISDWLTASSDKNSYQIMRRHAFKSKMFTLMILYTGYICIILYISAAGFMYLKNTYISNAETNITLFVLPSGDLGEKVAGSLYMTIIILQSFQLIAMGITQCIADSFYLNVTLHLAGQLKVLKLKFETFADKPDTSINHRKRMINLINRHCELVELNKNLEDTFHLIILYQLIAVTLLFAMLGLRTVMCLQDSEYILFMKSIFVLQFVFVEAVMYAYGGDFVQSGSEGLFYAMYTTSLYTFSATLMKDLRFAMMRSNYPFRLSGGKFFYANRETMMNVVKTAASYVSVLRVAVNK